MSDQDTSEWLFDESRRLTGSNLYFDGPGVALETAPDLAIDDAMLQLWRDNVAAAQQALRWPDAAIVIRRHRSGASLTFAAPMDKLYAATEVNEWALSNAAACPFSLRASSSEEGRERQLHAPGHAAVWDAESALHTLGLLAAAEANPALLTLHDAAATRELPFLSDDDEVSIGTGCGSRTWPIDALPTSAEVDWSALHAIPSALVTGSNGKTTTVRLLAAMARSNGWTTGYSSTDGLFVDAQRIDSGDYSGPMGARTVLRQTEVEAAILETARGGLLRRGLAVDNACVAVVTNVSPDHFGEYGIHDLDALADVKLTVARGLAKDGLLILNADDTLLLRRGAVMSRRIGWFALDDEHPQLRAHRDAGGATCGVRDGHLQLHFDDVSHDLGAIAEMPITLSGAARYNIANAAAASLAATAMGIAIERIVQTLAGFGTRPGDNPGRLQRWQFGDTKVYLDYAHNPDGLDGLLQVATTDRDGGRLALILGQAGNREDADIRALAATAARFRPDRVWLKDMGEDYMRGRASGEVAEILGDELTKQGVPASAQSVCLDEGDAVREVLRWAKPGDVLVLPIHQADSRDEIVALLDALDHAHWRPGQAVPAMPVSQSDVSG